MTLQWADRVKEVSVSTGTGALALGGGFTGYRTFGSVCGNGDTGYYAVENPTTGEWEVGQFTYNSGPNTITRSVVQASSNGNSLVNFGAGSKTVFLDLPANRVAQFAQLDQSSTFTSSLNNVYPTESLTPTGEQTLIDIDMSGVTVTPVAGTVSTFQRFIRIKAPEFSVQFSDDTAPVTVAALAVDAAPFCPFVSTGGVAHTAAARFSIGTANPGPGNKPISLILATDVATDAAMWAVQWVDGSIWSNLGSNGALFIRTNPTVTNNQAALTDQQYGSLTVIGGDFNNVPFCHDDMVITGGNPTFTPNGFTSAGEYTVATIAMHTLNSTTATTMSAATMLLLNYQGSYPSGNLTITNLIGLHVQTSSANTNAMTLARFDATAFQSVNILEIRTNFTLRAYFDPKANLVLAPLNISSATASPVLSVTAAAHLTTTASTEVSDVIFNLAATTRFANEALTTQRAFLVTPRTYRFVSGSNTITTAVVQEINGASVAGTSCVILNNYVFRINTVQNAAVGIVINLASSATGHALEVQNQGSILSYIDANGNFSGNAANVSGTVAIANGGSGQTGANAALNAFLPTQTSNSGKFLTTDGSNTSWATAGGGGGGVTVVNNTDGTLSTSGSATTTVSLNLGHANVWTAQQNFGSATITASGGTVAWNLSSAQIAYLSLAGDYTIGAPSNMVNGGTYVLQVQQSGGGNPLTFNAAFKWPNGTAPTASSTNGAVDILTFFCDGTHMYGVAVQNF